MLSKDDVKVELRELTLKDRNQYETLLNACFPVEAGHSFFEDFPIWDPSLVKDAFRLGYFENDELMGTASLRSVKLYLGDSPGAAQKLQTAVQKDVQKIDAGIVGAVSTHPNVRGQGVASELVRVLTERADLNGLAFTLLWGSEHSLYERIGFQLFGEQFSLPLAALLRANEPETLSENEKIEKGYRSEIFQMRANLKSGISLSESDRIWFEAHKNVNWWSLIRDNKAVAYVGTGRGIDLQGFLHEWSGNIEELLKLFQAVLNDDRETQWLTSRAELLKWGIIPSEKNALSAQFLCMIRARKGFDLESNALLLKTLWINGLDAA